MVNIILNITLYLFFLGLLVGGPLTVFALRTLTAESIVYSRALGYSCGCQVKPYDLASLFSFLLLKVKCRYCDESTSSAFFWWELATGVIFAWAGWMWGWQWETLVALFIISILVIVVQTDVHAMVIPNKVIFYGITVGIILRIFIHDLPLWNHLISMVLGGGIFYLISVVSSFILKKDAIGGGDIKLFAFIGLILGFKLLFISMLISSLLGFLFAVALLLSGRIRLGSHMPYGPCIALGSLISYGWGNSIAAWYMI